MAVVDSVVGFLVQKLGDALVQEAIFLHGVRDQVRSMEEEFWRMQSFLKDADDKQEGDQRVKNWVREVRNVAYDAEDAIDTYIFEITNVTRRGGFIRSLMRYAFIFNELIALHNLGSSINQIQGRIQAISQSRLTYGIENIGRGEGASSDGHIPSPHVQEPDFVGFREDAEILVMRLTEGELRRCVVAVVGMGGLGKTTLAKKVYSNDRVKKHFDSRAWISISQQYSAKNLLTEMVKRFVVLSDEELKKVEIMKVDELSRKVYSYLEGKRYLIVVDDIWQNQAWDALQDALPDVNNGSRVLLTTRKKRVALHADVRSQPHELRLLEADESWELFCKKTFPGQGNSCPKDLEKLGREIVGECHGLPLAIVVIGGLLSTKEPGEWGIVHKSIRWQFKEGEVKISSILSSSYKDLPYHLKPCFLYLGIFPEDHEFRPNKLIRLWVAEGLLQHRGEITLEEVGEECLKDLIHRSMIQVTKRSSGGGIKRCRVHDLLRDLSISEAEEDEFLEVHRGNVEAPPPLRARRLAFHHSAISKYTSMNRSTPHLRSVYTYTQGHERLEKKQLKFLYRDFKLLRVLCLHGVRMKELPSEVGALIHLRYLGCTETSLKSLPSSIGDLCNLQTLHVTSDYNIHIPSSIGKTQELRHLHLKSVHNFNYFAMFEGWGVIKGRPNLHLMSNLQTLNRVMEGKWIPACLGKLKNLRKLGICLGSEAYVEAFMESIIRLPCLRSLLLLSGYKLHKIPQLVPLTHLVNLCKMHLHGPLEKLPESHEFPANLIKLTLSYSFLEQDPLVTLETLENLRILKLFNDSYVGREIVCTTRGFPKLEFLHFKRLDNLDEWRVEEGSMPRLLHLRINECRQLNMLPKGLQHVTTLKTLELWNMNQEFEAGLQKDKGEDWHVIRRIPSIDIRNF